MKTWKKLCLASLMGTSLFLGALPVETGAYSSSEGIQSVTGVAKVYGDGEKTASSILAYPEKLVPGSISTDTFEVPGKTIEKAWVSDEASAAGREMAGPYVVLQFKYSNESFFGNLSSRAKKDNDNGNGPKGGAPGGDAPMHSNRVAPDLSISVKQKGYILSPKDNLYTPGEFVKASKVEEPMLDSFKQYVYKDPSTGYSMPYNLYLPKNYDPAKKYPLVVFIGDASVDTNDPKTSLYQGNGGTIWAEPEEQAKHECIILIPHYTDNLINEIGMMITDSNTWTPGLTLTSDLIFDVSKKYAVDTDRIYGMGQSQGGIANIAISDKYPDFFAAQLLVACQWNVDEMKAMKDKKLWIIVSEGDNKAYPGMSSAVSLWKSLGTKVAEDGTFWDTKGPWADLETKAKALKDTGYPMHFTVFKDGNHMYTWSVAYNLETVRDWLFEQKKEENK